MEYIEKLALVKYSTLIICLIPAIIFVVAMIGCAAFQFFSLRRKIKWLERNGFEPGIVDFCSHLGYRRDNIYLTDKDICYHSLKEIKIMVEEKVKIEVNR